MNTPITLTETIRLPNLERQPMEPRALKSIVLSAITVTAAVTACIPLFSVLIMLIYRGGKRLSLEIFYALPPTAFEMGGGFGNAIVGTLFMVGIASLISVPFGVLAAVYLAELGPYSRVSQIARFCAKTMTGLPSILAGVFAYAAVVLVMGSYSAWAGGIALSLLMIPVVMLTAEEAIKMVPQSMKDAALGMGCTASQSMVKVVLPVAIPGIITGVVLAVARAAGETAPLLFTALFSDYWLQANEPTASLAVLIYNYSGMPFDNQIELAWTASLVLVLMVLVLNVVSRIIGRRKRT
ncbi:phosphate transport system permease protein PstA [Desulfosarcina ovata subsp. sediminis]|uniref:Phosphate transport system permease protein PstA n=1 Tax=Desulfosarcina ovata subsp. sediminis TaxID=885957 RepID=A0A5K7ZQ32_9BACT|nr:phosphate ABC transporter permease PstA [Desulfosarcina ovata]BBO82169.1 phosphate transport system permease protein PstA [Desulfosarcina ovata subsp. sediminis]